MLLKSPQLLRERSDLLAFSKTEAVHLQLCEKKQTQQRCVS